MSFNIFEKLLPPKNTVFYDIFQDAAKNCLDIATLLNDTMENGISDDRILRARTYKHRGSTLERETIGLLNSTFITPIDREDIQLLASMLNKITKKISQALLNLNAYNLVNYTDELKEQASAILKATTELQRSVGLLRTLAKTSDITHSRDLMKEIETLGDDIHYRATAKLFSGEFEALEVIKLRDIYKLLESAMDKCNSVSDVILNIALKNS
ncbi:MAG: DUF47 family protein [bacterium]|nr:DUF47 family protein [bacterium]